jgi:hypothetical protein
MAVIDHKKLKYDEEFAAYCGRFVVEGRKFEAIVTVPELRPERAWAIAEKAVDLVLHRFSAVEKDVEKNLAPRLVMCIAGEVARTPRVRGDEGNPSHLGLRGSRVRHDLL